MPAQTLLLNMRMRPHEVLPWQEAVTRLFNQKIRVLETYPEVIGTVTIEQLTAFEFLIDSLPADACDGNVLTIRMPAVAVLKRQVSNMKRGVKFSKMNVVTRDRFRCQYCGNKKKIKDLNYDHVLPRSQGGKTVWENIVASCFKCNGTKGGRTPAQAGMRLLSQPHRPKVLEMVEPIISESTIHPLWVPWIGGDAA